MDLRFILVQNILEKGVISLYTHTHTHLWKPTYESTTVVLSYAKIYYKGLGQVVAMIKGKKGPQIFLSQDQQIVIPKPKI